MNKFVALSVVPALGSNLLLSELEAELSNLERWYLADFEFGIGGYHPMEQIMDSHAQRLKPYSKEFINMHVRPRQDFFRTKTRRIADFLRCSALIMDFMGDLTSEVDISPRDRDIHGISARRLPLLEKIQKVDFAEYEFLVIQLLLVPSDHFGSVSQRNLDDSKWVQAVADGLYLSLSGVDLRYASLIRYVVEQGAPTPEELEGLIVKTYSSFLKTANRFPQVQQVLWPCDRSAGEICSQIADIIYPAR